MVAENSNSIHLLIVEVIVKATLLSINSYCPVPRRCTVCVCPTAYVMVIVPGSKPTIFGWNPTVIVQLLPGARLAPQLSLSV